ncbi:LANO_0A06150g1_1 [Lachancea nothofagi CBS 11611]|uniref:LANO_0A06150g1_1 n=1 Tax=Lachancea nothofagi CBS 11611 TaxID=1266666 RepID=A0A1G4IRL4_9SACH|nr:LANO_0A06150g1_1 [Lachancea nothofagi CBS 11611]
MFELPTTLNNNRIRTVRKLRYQYINALHREFGKIRDTLSPNTTLPTPENSAAEEASDADLDRDSVSERLKRKRRRRRLMSVLGHAGSDSELSDVEAEEYSVDTHSHQHRFHHDSEKEFYGRHEKPQDTFEIWNTSRSKATPMDSKTISYAECRHIEQSAQRRMASKNAHIPQSAKLHYAAMKNGHEIFSQPSLAYYDTHLQRLNELLHLNIMTNRWESAYRCFSILLRLPGVDIRSMWGAGVRILRELSASNKNIGTSQDFLGWLSSIYTSKSNFNHSMNRSLDPVFRSGSKTHSAKFVIAWMWESLIACCTESDSSYAERYSKVNNRLPALIEKLSEMVLVPPYMEDSEVWFIYAMCHLISADQLSERFSHEDEKSSGLEKDIARNQVIQHITKTHNCIKACLAKNDDFRFPHRVIQEQLASFEKRLYHDQNSDVFPSNSDTTGEEGSEILSHELDTQEFLAPDVSSFVGEDDDEDFFGRSERVHFGFDSDSSSS